MNLSLQDPQYITADFPTTLTTTLSYGHCTALKISPCGHYIASGLLDGTILIIDTWTNNVTCMLRTHIKAITGIKWIYKEDKENLIIGLYSWSNDWKFSFHVLKNSKLICIYEKIFPGGIWNVDLINCGNWDKNFNKLIDWEFIICRNVGGIIFVKFDNETNEILLNDKIKTKIKDNDNNNNNDDNQGVQLCCCTFFGGKYSIVGTSKGWIQIIDNLNLEIIKINKICNGNIKSINIVERSYYDDKGKLLFGLNNVPISRLIINSSDRILRQYDITNWYDNETEWKFEIDQKYNDVVNRIQWNTIKFSPTGEYVCSSTQGSSVAAHDIYVWETSMGSLVQILEGSHEELIDVDWGIRSTNGNVCCIISNGMDSGTIFVWGVKASQKWSALAPDFEEIEQNIEYIENEDEFDLIGGINQSNNNKIDGIEEEGFKVDVITREEKDARGFKFIKGCIIDTQLED